MEIVSWIVSWIGSFLSPSSNISSTMSTIITTPSNISFTISAFMPTILSTPSTIASTILYMSTITTSSLPPPSSTSTVLSTPSSTFSTASSVSTMLSTPSTMASTISYMSTIFSTPSTTSSLPPPSSTSTMLSTAGSTSVTLSPLSSMATILSTMSTTSGFPSYNQTIDCPSHEEALRVPLTVFYSLLFVVGLTANLLALWVFLFLRREWDSMHILLMNSAVSDLLLLALVPFRVYYHANGDQWHLGAMACGLVTTLFNMNKDINIAMLGLIGVGRYAWLRRRGGSRRARCTPVRNPCGVPWTWVVCGLIWGLALCMLVYAEAKRPLKDPEDKKCFQYTRWDKSGCIASLNVAMEVMFWLVFVVHVVSYGKIAISQHGRSAGKSFFVLFLFTVCFVPYHVFHPFKIQSELHQSDYTVADLCRIQQIHQLMVLVATFNSCMDPVMYFLLSGLMRKAAARAFGTHSCRTRDGEGLL